MRADLNMRKGKMIAQGAHAAMAFLTRNGGIYQSDLESKPGFHVGQIKNLDELKHWLNESFTKVCLRVDSEEELLQIHQNAVSAGLISYLITDSGKTEFNGVSTRTCLAIGPHESSKIDGITGHLKLL